MKEYMINYVETMGYTYYYEAESAEDARKQFNKDVEDGNVDFTDGDCLDSDTYIYEGVERSE